LKPVGLVPVEHAYYFLQLSLRQSRVSRGRLDIRVPQQMRLHGSQISFGAPQQLRAAAVTERMRMKLPHAHALPSAFTIFQMR
jgi:hypothetical protein